MENPQIPKKPKGIVQKAKSLGKAIKSIHDNGFATPELQQRRLDLCMKTGGTYCDDCSRWIVDGDKSCKCEAPRALIEGPCPLLMNDKNGLHCSQCACNQTVRATDIRMKVIAPRVDCPRELWSVEDVE